jgi:hypothetical protein
LSDLAPQYDDPSKVPQIKKGPTNLQTREDMRREAMQELIDDFLNGNIRKEADIILLLHKT